MGDQVSMPHHHHQWRLTHRPIKVLLHIIECLTLTFLFKHQNEKRNHPWLKALKLSPYGCARWEYFVNSKLKLHDDDDAADRVRDNDNSNDWSKRRRDNNCFTQIMYWHINRVWAWNSWWCRRLMTPIRSPIAYFSHFFSHRNKHRDWQFTSSFSFSFRLHVTEEAVNMIRRLSKPGDHVY